MGGAGDPKHRGLLNSALNDRQLSRLRLRTIMRSFENLIPIIDNNPYAS